MLGIQTFDPRTGGNMAYKALTHPWAAEKLAILATDLAGSGPVAIYDPHGIAQTALALLPARIEVAGIYTHDSLKVGQPCGAWSLLALADLPRMAAKTVWALDFSHAVMENRLSGLLPAGSHLRTLAEVRLPDSMLSVAHTYLDGLNFGTNLAFFRDTAEFSTRLVSANYWSRYGADNVRFWLRLYDQAGRCCIHGSRLYPARGRPSSLTARRYASVSACLNLPGNCSSRDGNRRA